MRKLRNREMVNPAQRHIAEKWQSQNSSGLSSTRVWILSWLKVTECVDERLGFQLSVQSSDCNLVHWHSVQTLLLRHCSCISVYVFQLMELYSWFQKWVSVTQFWPALLVRTTDKGMGMCLQVAKKKKKKFILKTFLFGKRGFLFPLCNYLQGNTGNRIRGGGVYGDMPDQEEWSHWTGWSLGPPVPAPGLFHHLSQ